MSPLRLFLIVVLVACAPLLLPAAGSVSVPSDAALFNVSAPGSDPSELSRRMGAPLDSTTYDITRERFRIIAPPSLSTKSGWGLFVWISPGDDAYIPKDWELLFAKHQQVFAAPYLSGNNRPLTDRFRLALDATRNVSQRYGLDPKRVFVGGFSGGGRIASMLALAYPDVFTGAFCVCGVNFYQDVSFASEEATGMAAGSLRPGQVRPSPTIRYPASFRPPQAMLEQAKRTLRVYLLTGSADQNRLNTKTVYEDGFRKQRYRHVKYREIPGFGHNIPNAPELEKALNFLSPQQGAEKATSQ